ncbi:hypothetical protein GLYMA_15G236800v4 [Glycine max]|uniref:Uncharacterized protein n=1 Tax=Glycine max TaxID=3847 RepID=K7MDG4_SOYBN|nr:hypothetical protein GLYMA_15G236800v4 [Glycine max]
MVSFFSSLNCILFKSVIFIFHTQKKYHMGLSMMMAVVVHSQYRGVFLLETM